MDIISKIPNVYSFSVELKASHDMKLPAFKGSMLRGLLGTALRHRYCQRQFETECIKCDRKFSCVHAFLLMGIFSPTHKQEKFSGFSNFPHPYTISAPLSQGNDLKKNDSIHFTLNLLEPAIEYLIIWLQALIDLSDLYADKKRRGRLLLDSVTNIPSGIVLYSDGLIVNAQVEKRELIRELPSRCYLKLITPLRLKKDGKPLFDILSSDILCRRMLGRVNHLNGCYGNGSNIEYNGLPFFEITGNGLYWQDIPHRSNRQNTKLKMGGLIGSLEINIINKTYSPLIHFSTIFGLGSYVTAGYGKMELLF